MKKNLSILLGLLFVFLLAACSVPGGHGRTPIKITALNETVWSYLQQDGTYFVIAFKGSGTSYYVGSSSSNNLSVATTQALANANNRTTYDSKKPGEISFSIQGTQRLFRPISETEAELLSSGPNSKTIIMKRIK